MTQQTDRELLHSWLAAQIRRLLAEARGRHPSVLSDGDTEVLAELVFKESGREERAA